MGVSLGSHGVIPRFGGEKALEQKEGRAEVYRGRPARCIELFLLWGFCCLFFPLFLFFFFFFSFPFYFFFNSTLDLQACALWVRDYFSVKRVFCHSIEKIKKKSFNIV